MLNKQMIAHPEQLKPFTPKRRKTPDLPMKSLIKRPNPRAQEKNQSRLSTIMA